MKLIFTNYPFTKEEGFIYGIEGQEAFDEFLQLFELKTIDRNISCKFPNAAEYEKIKNKLHSQELKNILNKYVDKEILVLPETEDFSVPKATHFAKI